MWATTVVTSGKQGVIRQSKGKGHLKVKDCHLSGQDEIMDKAYVTTEALRISKVLEMIGLPALSIGAAMFTTQRMIMMLMKAELFAVCCSMQILCVGSVKCESTEALGLYIPRSEALRKKGIRTG